MKKVTTILRWFVFLITSVVLLFLDYLAIGFIHSIFVSEYWYRGGPSITLGQRIGCCIGVCLFIVFQIVITVRFVKHEKIDGSTVLFK